ncbi:MAG: hypothetical protein GXP42_16975 [Chloroflexi bacterium]|nr:hypothetical protein [Chloroflexota bacterium]
MISRRSSLLLSLVFALIAGLGFSLRAGAQSAPRVQIITHELAAHEAAWYRLSDIQAGETLYVRVETLDGNFDPFVGLVERNLQGQLGEEFEQLVRRALAEGQDPIAMLDSFASDNFIAWDDDGGPGYAASLSHTFSESGDYWLLVTGSPFHESFGRFRLTVGINEPAVLTGEAQATGDEIIALQLADASGRSRVQELRGRLSPPSFSTFFDVRPLEAGDALYVFAEPLSGDFRPTLVLSDFGGKPVASGNFGGATQTAVLEYVFDEGGRGYQLTVTACCRESDDAPVEYRLLVGVNAPDVLNGQAQTQGSPVLNTPIPVKIGIRLQQITNVDQKAENFDAVATLRMEWIDPALAFSPDTCDCQFKLFTANSFNQFIQEAEGKWPEFTLFNQQGNRWVQNRAVVVYPTGRAIYIERFTTTFQAPDFNFKQFPFDIQHFFIRVDSLFPAEFYVFENDAEFTQIGDQLGEEEWYIVESSASVTTTIATTQALSSRYSFDFNMRRHLNFYIFRIFIPLLLIILVSWITFFLKDYNKRVDVTSANLLLFIAFNFTISDDLPRLGYLTYLDTLLTTTFAISVFVVLFNVALKRLEQAEKTGFVQTVDNYTIWLYPVAYLAAFSLVTYRFFGPFF